MFVRQNNYEELIFKEEPRYAFVWISLIFISLITVIIISCFYKYNKFYVINGLVVNKGSDNYVQVLLENDKLDIIENADLNLNGTKIKFDYEVSSYFYSDSGKTYREIKIFFENNLDDGEIVNFVFKSPQTTLIEELKTNIKKGMI